MKSYNMTKTKLVEFGRFAQRHASKRGRNRPQAIYFLGFTLRGTTSSGIPLRDLIERECSLDTGHVRNISTCGRTGSSVC
jgi:hypothetical protein